MAAASLQFGNLTAGNGNYIFQGIQNPPLTSALERKHFRHGNPPPLNRNFLGRNDEITAIKAAFREAEVGKQKRYVIYGMAGIGKSEICVKLINDMQSGFWGVFWVDVSDFASAEGNLKNIADQIRPGTAHQDLGHALSALAEVDFNTHPWLLVLDNADELREDYARFSPSAPGGSILLTSRNHECTIHETVGCCELESISFKDSVLLLLKAAKVRQRHWESYWPHAEIITKLLGSHTLTLVQAGAFISRDVRNWNEYPKLFKENRQNLLAISGNQGKSKYGNVYASFEVSARTLESDESTEAKDALCLLGIFSMFHHSGFPTLVFEDASKGVMYAETHVYGNEANMFSARLANLLPEFLSDCQNSPLRLQTGLYCLEALSFIKQASTDDQDEVRLVSMHPLAHSWAKDRLDQRKKEQAWMMAGSIISFSVKNDPKDNAFYMTYSMWRLHAIQLQSHIDSFLDNSESCRPQCPWHVERFQIHYVISRLLQEFSLFQEEESFLLKFFRSIDAEPSRPENIGLLPLHQEIADAWSNLQKHSASIDLWKRIILLQEANCVCEKDFLDAKRGLAIGYMNSGETTKAIGELESIVSIHKGLHPADDKHYLASQHTLGCAYLDDGQVEKAIGLFEHVVQVQQKMLPESSSERLGSETALGRAYLDSGEVKRAIELLEHTTQVRQRTVAESSSKRLASEHTLGCAYLNDGQVEKAIELFEHVVQVQQKTRPESSVFRLRAEHQLGVAYHQKSRPEEALQLFEHVARIERAELHSADPNRLRVLSYLPDLYMEVEQPEKAKEVVVEFDNALKSLSMDDARWREHGEWLAGLKQYFGIEDRSHALSEYDPDPGSDAPADSTNAEYGNCNESGAGLDAHDAEYEREVDENPPRWKRFAKCILKRDRRKE